MTLYGSLASKSSLVDTEHLPKVRKTVTPITSLTLQGQTRIVGSELTLVSAPRLVSREQKQLLLVETYNQCRYLLQCVVARISQPMIKQFPVQVFLLCFSHILQRRRDIPNSQGVCCHPLKFKVWLWKRNTDHDGVSIQNHCSIISFSKTFSNVP